MKRYFGYNFVNVFCFVVFIILMVEREGEDVQYYPVYSQL